MRNQIARFTYVLLCAMVALVLGCTETTARSALDDQSNPHEFGQRLYSKKCAQCHALYPASSYSDVAWKRIMNDMGTEAHLKSAEYQAILSYLKTSN